jgi:hypothetical protein
VSTGFGDIAADLTAEAVQFLTPAATFSIAAPGAGADTYNANAYLIYVVPAQVDQTISDDPNISASAPQNAVLPYYNASDTETPYQGPGGTNPPTQQPSARTPVGQLFITAASTFPSNASNAAAIAGAVAALTMPAGAIPLYVVARTHGAALLAANVWAAGLGTCPALTALIAQGGGVGTVAPFLRGTMQQHHLGVPGSAPQIDGGAEWLPLSVVNNNGQRITNIGAPTSALDAVRAGDLAPGAGTYSPSPSGTFAGTSGHFATLPTVGASAPYCLLAAIGTNVATLQLQTYKFTINFVTASGAAPAGDELFGLTGIALKSAFPHVFLGLQVTVQGVTTGGALPVNVTAAPNAGSPLSEFDIYFSTPGVANGTGWLYNNTYALVVTVTAIGY